MARLIALAAVATTLSCGFTDAFTLVQQQEMDRAVLLDRSARPEALAKSHVCLSLQGRAPSKAFLRSLGRAGAPYMPMPADITSQRANCSLRLMIDDFDSDPVPDQGHADILYDCGARCGEEYTVTVSHFGPKWTVDSIRRELLR